VQKISNRRYGFSLLEVVLAIGVFAFASVLFIGFANAQLYFETKNQTRSEAMDIMDDFCSFVEISSFDDIKGFKDANATFYVTEEEDGEITYRKFVPSEVWEMSHGGKLTGYAIGIEPMEALFAGEDSEFRYYIPLTCKLFKVDKDSQSMILDAIGEDFSTFIAAKNY
jgi:hypothetical protein